MKPVTIHGAPEGFDALLVARRRAEIDAPIAHVCRDDARMGRQEERAFGELPDDRFGREVVHHAGDLFGDSACRGVGSRSPRAIDNRRAVRRVG